MIKRCNWYPVLAGLVIIVFVLSRLPVLQLPLYWDEAWVYGPAINLMAERGLSLLPDSIPVYYSRGHPLLFHFLGASWIKIFGNSMLSLHSFALTITTILLIVVYRFGKEFYSPSIALLAVIVLSLQPVFIAQSVFVLPEMMLALFSMLSLYYFLKGRFLLYFIFGSATVMTKESGLVVIACITLFYFIINLTKKKQAVFTVIINALKYLLPVLVLFIFLIIQYFIQSWFLFPGHTGLINFDLATVWGKLTEGYGAYLFIYQGRNLLTLIALIGLIFYFIRKKKFREDSHVTFLLLLFVLGFLLFSSINFFSNRYILCILPAFVFITIGVFFKLITNKIVYLSFIIILVFSQVHQFNKLTNSDHNIGYVNAVKAYQSVINYCIDNNLQDKSIYAYFITRTNMTNPYAGYVEKGQEFSNVLSEFSPDTDYYIFSNFDSDKNSLENRNKPYLKLIKKFEYRQAWIELYKNTDR